MMGERLRKEPIVCQVMCEGISFDVVARHWDVSADVARACEKRFEGRWTSATYTWNRFDGPQTWIAYR